jgi:adenylate cyclase
VKFLKKLFRITPLKLSLTITLVFICLSFYTDNNPNPHSVMSILADKSLDVKFKLRGYRPAKAKTLIVAGDEKAFQTFGQWPFDRGSVFAALVDRICQYNPRVIGFDLVWSEKEKVLSTPLKNAINSAMGSKAANLDTILSENSGDLALKNALSRCKSKIVMGYAFDYDEANGTAPAEYKARLKTLTDQGKNTPRDFKHGDVRYHTDHFTHDGSVQFSFIAKTGLLNSPTVVPDDMAQGFFNNDADDDGNYRRATFFFRAGSWFTSSLAMRMSQKILSFDENTPLVEITAQDDQHAPDLKLYLPLSNGKREIPIDLNGQGIINFRGPNKTFPNVSMADVLSSKDTVEFDRVESSGAIRHEKAHKSELFKDANVLIGMTALALYDIRPRPFDAGATGVENHANILDNIIADDFLVRPTNELLLGLLCCLLVISLAYGAVIARLGAGAGAVFAATTLVGLLYFDQVVLFNQRNIVFSGHLQAAQFLFQYIAITVLKYMQEESEKKFIRSAFDKYVSPAVINTMLQDPSKLRLGGEKRELSILFSDIRGFTELSEKVDVKALTSFLNEYLGAMTNILQGNSGTLDKYIGDAVMGFWGAPIDLQNHASLAVKTAVEMMAKLDELNAEFQKKYSFTIDIGIGINSGAVSVGNFGSNKVFEYTVIGDNVNLASRLEGINKYYGTHIIISESTFAQLPAGEFLTREVDTVKVKGKHKPVKIYEVFPDNAAHQTLKHSLSTFNEGLRHYYGKKWEEALQFFHSVTQARQGDKPSLELIERCNYYKSNPPPLDWDGSWEMHSK